MNQYSKPFHFSWTQFGADATWAFQLLCSDRKDASIKRAMRFCLHSALNIHSSAVWLRFLRETNLLTTSVSEATFVDRIHRPFFDKRYSTKVRTTFLRSHFTLLSQLLNAQHLHQVISGAGINLSTITGKSGEIIEVNLVRLPDYDKEGGSSIELRVNGTTIQLMTFTLVQQHNRTAIKIGGIQSKDYPDKDCRSMARDTTHALHGIQPRILMIETLRNLAQQLKCATIECINEENHIYRALRYRNKKAIHAQYNHLWEIVGGTLHSNGNFTIPSYVEAKPIESRPSKKRNEYRHRALLLDSVRNQMNLLMQPMQVIAPFIPVLQSSRSGKDFSPAAALLEIQ